MPVIEAAEAAAVAAGVAREAFAYNRENYMFDAGLRWARFNTGYGFAIAQASQYREDISDLTEFVVTKADTYHTVGTICFVLNFQLIMAGRLGVHGPSPPGWLLGLYWTNICGALCFLVMFTWMAMHAGARATAGAAHMRTRSVRLPIPTPSMLDQARVTGNSFEKQRLQDMFRIPFVKPAGKETEVDPETGYQVPASDRRIPKWFNDEKLELRKDQGGATQDETSCPEHFELYRGLQEEWWAYDVYSRIGVTFFFSHWLTAASLYSMCHIFTELRCMWPAWTVVPCFVTAHYGILHLEISKCPRQGALNVPMERIVPFVPFLAVLGMNIDYSVLTPTPFLQGFIYFLSWVGYVIQFLWSLRLLQLASPQCSSQDAPDLPGQPWAPKEWPVPPAFERSVYVVAAPRTVDPTQPCILQEMKAARVQGDKIPQKKAKVCEASMLPWKLFRGACITVIGMWVLIMVGRAFEMVNGERFLLKQEGRVERWPSHMQPWMAPWTRKGSRNEMCHAGGCDRRLSESETELAMAAQKLVTALTPIAGALENSARLPSATPATSPKALAATEVSWPESFAPEYLASLDRGLAAIARKEHRMALVDLSSKVATSVTLEGLEALEEIIGAASSKVGLLLTLSSGSVAECSGTFAAGSWMCSYVAAPKLPTGVASATVARTATGGYRAACTFDGEDSVVLFELTPELSEWAPAGEIGLPSADIDVTLSLSNPEQLVITMGDGSMIKRDLTGKHQTKQMTDPTSSPSKFHGGCCMGGNKIAQLSSGMGMLPKLHLSHSH
mmetsp:Transcript_27076/g.58967  ORF Transcript_27076/g.58967 Transcript_27076/m.58967 type:complete len:786 (-) Transcript_27076:78-2435(-)|eukprot:CAMPEP_0206435510 /NCGR_PEP_ID=MMETSP0324_2-20121206/9911_1 /ASSEMBLY_ACC=CAM_ASM_000836 /TAXON_ID=2866 /ORGANISM="Crypthecodinium cohnii, Strain Seligo" /LENGTH=785 /DNA_ID=CAMNT_0053902459 /DNA_START=72 /DNA_END=2429 /DNA_ORIENTATION=+